MVCMADARDYTRITEKAKDMTPNRFSCHPPTYLLYLPHRDDQTLCCSDDGMIRSGVSKCSERRDEFQQPYRTYRQ